MRRREALAAGGVALGTASAGCLSSLRREDAWRELVVDPPDGVYVPPHADEMVTVGEATDGGREVSLHVTRPHSFWTLAGAERSRAAVRSRHDLHLMVDVRDVGSGVIVPSTVTTTIQSGTEAETATNGGESTDRRTLWPMLSQRMGVHYGDNVALEGEGTDAVTVRVGPTLADPIGPLPTELEESASVDIPFEYDPATIEGLERRLIDANEGRGEPDALEPMGNHGDGSNAANYRDGSSNDGHGDGLGNDGHGDDLSVGGPVDRSPFDRAGATRVGSASVGDLDCIVVIVTDLDRGEANADTAESVALAVAVRTPYNRYPIPFATLSATIAREGNGIAAGSLREVIDPRDGHHYRTDVDPALLERGDQLAIIVETPPQLARHEGYETAFLETGMATVNLE
ncbi:hypothetical protein AB7C87_15980 [Natrarchaeobius sp. A-rgal3]|uniref:DUF7350 domain-containing protein n=1 Tax=Natrarchaeobius versutus TaxID=1679078 RepID=UPI00350EB58A